MTDSINDRSELPLGWVWTSISETCWTTSGGTPSRKRPDFFDGEIPWLKSGELNNGLIYETEERISRDALESSSAKVFPSGTLTIALYGATVGKLGILKIDAATNQAVAGVFTPDFVQTKYLFWFLFFYRPALLDERFGGAQPNISQAILKEIEFPLPPLPEQHRIVAKIEELFSDLDASVAALTQAQAHLRIYRQAVLKYAFDGRLTERWRAQHAPPPASELLAQIRAERAQRHQRQLAEWKADVQRWEAAGRTGRKPARPRQPDELAPLSAGELEELGELPEGWAWAKLRDISEIVGGITKGRDFSGQPTVRLPYLRVANVQDGYLDLADVRDIEALPTELEKYRLEPGDILYTEGGDKDKLGRGAVWQGEIPNCIHQNHIFRARVFQHLLNADFIALNSQTKGAKHYFFSNAKQTVNLASINMTVLGNLPVPIPGTSEQQAIVAEIEARLSVVDKLEETLAAALRQAEALRQSILQRAFAGKLVPQDPSDEPAQQLLERIRKARPA
ncbi:MAG: restriction endonuclease subunit S [Anaerolineae bacterium]